MWPKALDTNKKEVFNIISEIKALLLFRLIRVLYYNNILIVLIIILIIREL